MTDLAALLLLTAFFALVCGLSIAWVIATARKPARRPWPAPFADEAVVERMPDHKRADWWKRGEPEPTWGSDEDAE